jgi:pyridinium-3,5-bisthiocarboxylic acid mononucleotide nickel chelatase
VRILYFDCFSGISGDMILGALADLGFDLKKEMAGLRLPPFEIEVRRVRKGVISAVKVDVILPKRRQHEHYRLEDIHRVIDGCGAARDIRQQAKGVFTLLASAEAKVHGYKKGEVHFHELGDTDALVDILGALTGVKRLGIGRIQASRLNVGTGFVKCRHGLLPVPAPATAELLSGLPVYSTDTRVEILTPTGAALIRTLARSFGDMPPMVVEKVAYGAGDNELPQPSALRVFYGHLLKTVPKPRKRIP